MVDHEPPTTSVRRAKSSPPLVCTLADTSGDGSVKKKSRTLDPARKGLRIAGYVRVSSSRQVRECDSIESQKSRIAQYVAMKVQFKTRKLETHALSIRPGRSA